MLLTDKNMRNGYKLIEATSMHEFITKGKTLGVKYINEVKIDRDQFLNEMITFGSDQVSYSLTTNQTD